jgi:hypothetical protein
VLQRAEELSQAIEKSPATVRGFSLILVMLVCAAADPKTPASHPLFCQRVVCGMAWFLTFPCPLLQLRAVSPSRRQLLHFWGDFLFKEPTRLPSSSRQFRSGPPRSRIKSAGTNEPDQSLSRSKAVLLFDLREFWCCQYSPGADRTPAGFERTKPSGRWIRARGSVPGLD